MKGVYSSPDSLLGRATQQALFPSNTYGYYNNYYLIIIIIYFYFYSVDSGGDPLKIPDLTFDQFKSFHSNYYHPSNSRLLLLLLLSIQT